MTGSQSYPIGQGFPTPDNSNENMNYQSSQNFSNQVSFNNFNFGDTNPQNHSNISQPISTIDYDYPELNESGYIFDSLNTKIGDIPSSFDSNRTEVSRTVIQIHPQSMPPGYIIRKDIIHLNIENNNTPFAIVPIKKDDDTLAYVRQYIEMKIKQSPKDFLFLDKTGISIEKDHEKEILAYDNIVSDNWEHHTFKKNIKRDHLYIKPLDTDEGEPMKRRREEEHDDDDDEKKKRKKLEELFLSAPSDVQKKLAMSVFDHFHCNIKTSGGKTKTTSLSEQLIVNNNVKALNYVLVNGSNINEWYFIYIYSNEDGDTLLHLACKYNNWEIATLLLSSLFFEKEFLCGKVDVFKKNKEGKLPIYYAKNPDIKKLLQHCMDNTQVLNVITEKTKLTLEDIKDEMRNENNDIYLNNSMFILQGNAIKSNQESDIHLDLPSNTFNIEMFVRPFMMPLNDYKKMKEKSIIKKSPFKVSKPKTNNTIDRNLIFNIDRRLAPAASANKKL